MKRREFLKDSVMGAAALSLSPTLMSWVPTHNWTGYDFGSGPVVHDRLYQGPFPQYAPEDFYGGEVIQYTTPGKQLLNCYGMGLTTYIAGDLGAPHVPGESLETTIDKLFRFPLGTKVYIRPNWRHIQKRPGKLEPDDYWKITMDKAAKYGKRVGFRIMMNNPDIIEDALPEFMLKKLKLHKLKGTWTGDPSTPRFQHEHLQPDYSDPYFKECYEELQALLAEQYNGNPLIEYVDTCMYGLWGEGHTWPYEGNPYPSREVAEEAMLNLLDVQLKYWTKVPLVTNTQPDFSVVGNSAVLDKTVRTHNWIRTDSIFIENEQIEALSNRPAWIAAICEGAMTHQRNGKMSFNEDVNGMPRGMATIAHVKDVGPNYYSLWNSHNINADNLQACYDRFPEALDDIAGCIGFRIRPSWIWESEKDGARNLIFGMVNDGIAGVPGVLRLTLFTDDGKVHVSGCLDAGYPHPQGVRQAMLTLPAGVTPENSVLKLKAELEVKGVRHPVPFAVAQQLNPDGSLTIKRNTRG